MAATNLLFEENVISEFQDEFRFLSNFYPSPIEYGGMVCDTAEHLYQATKYFHSKRTEKDKEVFYKILDADTPGKTKKLAEQFSLLPSWHDKKVKIMKMIIHLKFQQNPDLKKLLKATRYAYLQEGNRWGDVFWGIDLRTGKGKNMLGTILMKEREFILHNEEFETLYDQSFVL